jgi:hypothetical protein
MTNYITIYKQVSKYVSMITFKNEMSKEDFLKVDLDHEKIVLSRVGIDHVGKCYKVTKKNSGWAMIGVSLENYETGKFLIDEEESNEDELVVYFEDKIN